MLLSDIAALTGGRLFGEDGQISALRRVCAASRGHLAIALRPQELRYLRRCEASAVLLNTTDAANDLDKLSCSALVVKDPFHAIDLILRHLHESTNVIVIGDGCDIDPTAVIKKGTRLGNRVKVGAHCVIGAEGFVFRDTPLGPVRIPHTYGVNISDDVELGSHVCVDAGMLAPTTIGAHTKIDNFVQIGHDVVIGSNCIIVAQAGIAGHATIGSHVSIGGQAGIGPFASIGDRAQVSARAAVFSDIAAGEIWSGSPAMPHMEFLRANARMKRGVAKPSTLD